MGVNPDTADMGYNGIEYRDIRKIRYDSIATTIPNIDSIPCWSLGALLELLREYNDCIKLDIFSNRSQKWQITISYYDAVWKEHEEININLLEAAYGTVVWLLENGYIKTEKK